MKPTDVMKHKRLPTRTELEGVVDEQTTPPKIISNLKNDTDFSSQSYYWSSDRFTRSGLEMAWVVKYLDGDTYMGYPLTSNFHCRCVRDL